MLNITSPATPTLKVPCLLRAADSSLIVSVNTTTFNTDVVYVVSYNQYDDITAGKTSTPSISMEDYTVVVPDGRVGALVLETKEIRLALKTKQLEVIG